MTRRVWSNPLKHESPRDVPAQHGHVKGVPFMDTPEGKGKSPFVLVRRDDWDAAIRAANAGRFGLAIAGLIAAIAIIWVSNSHV